MLSLLFLWEHTALKSEVFLCNASKRAHLVILYSSKIILLQILHMAISLMIPEPPQRMAVSQGKYY